MNDEDIKEILQKMEIPGPDESKKKATINVAMSEFHKQKYAIQNNTKGFEDERRLTGKWKKLFTFLGEFAMKKSFVTSGRVTACIAILVTGFIIYSVSMPKMLSLSVSNTTPSLNAQYKSEERHRLSVPGEKKNVASLNQVIRPQKRKAGKVSAMDSITRLPASGEHGVYEYQDIGRDKFETLISNPVKLVTEDPVSTFSVDVDTASYAFVRRQLNNGVLPQKNAVRVEEMINYFDYDYSVPTDKTRPFQPTIAVYPTDSMESGNKVVTHWN